MGGEEIDEEIFYTIPQLQQMNSPRRIKRKISNEEGKKMYCGLVELFTTNSMAHIVSCQSLSPRGKVHLVIVTDLYIINQICPFGKPTEQCIYFHACSL